MTRQLFFRLFAHNIVVRGKDRSAIYNLQHGYVLRIPTVYSDVLDQLRTNPISVVENQQTDEKSGLVDKCIQYLLGQDAGFLTEEPERFPDLKLDWKAPCRLQTAVVEYAGYHYDLGKTLTQLDLLECRHVELRVKGRPLDLWELNSKLETIADSAFRTVSLLIQYQPLLTSKEFVSRLYEAHLKIDRIVVYDCPLAESGLITERVLYTEKSINELQPTKSRYIININYFTECQAHNPFYNRNVCIDRWGNVKNSLSGSREFGNVRHQNISEIIQDEDFRALWYASPDRIDGLRDSELRYCLFLPEELVKNNVTGLYEVKQTKERHQELQAA